MATDDRLQALVEQWRTLGEFFATNTDAHQRDGAKLLVQCADELAALLASPVEATLSHESCHDLVCNGNRAFPRGERGHGCSCAGRDVRAGAAPVEAEPPSHRQVEGHCGRCGGITFKVVERCTGCGAEDVWEQLTGTPQADPPPSPARTACDDCLDARRELAEQVDTLRAEVARLEQQFPSPGWQDISGDERNLIHDALLSAEESERRAAEMWAGRCREEGYRAQANILQALRDKLFPAAPDPNQEPQP